MCSLSESSTHTSHLSALPCTLQAGREAGWSGWQGGGAGGWGCRGGGVSVGGWGGGRRAGRAGVARQRICPDRTPGVLAQLASREAASLRAHLSFQLKAGVMVSWMRSTVRVMGCSWASSCRSRRRKAGWGRLAAEAWDGAQGRKAGWGRAAAARPCAQGLGGNATGGG